VAATHGVSCCVDFKVLDYIALVDNACKTASAETLKEMQKHFIMSCKLEHMFWDQADALMDWPKILSCVSK
jgi:thiaminase (transcriptional activator TenA)